MAAGGSPCGLLGAKLLVLCSGSGSGFHGRRVVSCRFHGSMDQDRDIQPAAPRQVVVSPETFHLVEERVRDAVNVS